MQFCQPAFSGYAPNYSPPPFNPPPFQYNGYPEIIGEGHVTSIMSPDGSIQYLFLPTTQWCRPQSCNPNFGNSNIQWNNNGAWFIRSAYTPMQTPSYQAMYSPSYQGPCGYQPPLPVTSSSCIELHKPNYQMKFHNDGCTSTSDIHYFYPSLRASNWFQKQRSNSVCQTENSTTNSSSQDQESVILFCNQPCKCYDGNKTKRKVEDMSYSSNSNTSTNKMSLENCTETKCQKYKTKKSSKKKTQKENNHIICGCYTKEDKTKEKEIRICSSSNLSGAEKNSLAKSDESDRKKKERCKETKAICKCNDQPQTKGNGEDMSYSSNSNTSNIMSTENKGQKHKTKKSSRNKKPKETNHTCACYSKADKEAKVTCKCYDQPKLVNKSVVTFNEKGSNCKAEHGRETQTKFNTDTGSMTDISTNDQAKKPAPKTSYTIYGDYESCFGTPSCSCYSFSTSETESDKRKRPVYSKGKKTK